MIRKHTLVQVVALLLVVLMAAWSVSCSGGTVHQTNFSQDNILAHIENLTANGPRSIADKEENQLALDYIISELESWGVVNGNTTEAPAYLVQDFVAKDTDYQNWYLKNIIVHIPANGSAPTGEAVMFMGHTDSVPMGNGASDDGVAVSVMLEAVRYYLDRMEQGYTMNNDLVFCFVNGEEYGLYGSQAFMEEFTGFGNVVSRIKFGTNLESRGTAGTLIMFETAANNYNTVKLFAEINESVFTCSLATMIYDMMPNGTDFSNFKQAYQGMNFANIGGGEDYHTQNDRLENVGAAYLSQQALVVDTIIDRLANYELSRLYNAEESAIFFSYLNIATVVYDHTVTAVLAVLLLILVTVNVVLNRKKHDLKRTAIAIGSIVAGLVLTAAVTFGAYYLFQWVAVLTGILDSHMVGTITYSNNVIVAGIGLAALAVTILTSRLAVKCFGITFRDLTRGFAYIHGALGIVLSFVLADTSDVFVFSGILLVLNELLVTCVEKTEKYHLELFVTALYMPILMPVVVLATSALGLTMAYVFGLVFALGIFACGIRISALCENGCKLRSAVAAGCALAVAAVLFLGVSLTKPNASVNLQGKQNLGKLPYDDALVYVVDGDGGAEYRIYDLNARSALDAYAPGMTWADGYYAGQGKTVAVEYTVASAADGSVLTVNRVHEDTLVYLTFTNIHADSFTIDDGITANTYEIAGADSYGVTIHSDCTVTVNGGSADVAYREVLRDYAPLVPAGYTPEEQLHFNLWLTADFKLGGE